MELIKLGKDDFFSVVLYCCFCLSQHY